MHHQKVLHPQKETHMFFIHGYKRCKHRCKRETSSHRWTKDACVSNERIWQTRLSFTTTMNHRGKRRSVNVALLEGIFKEAAHAHQVGGERGAGRVAVDRWTTTQGRVR